MVPEFASDEQLLKCIHLDLEVYTKVFSDFCLRAKNSAQDAPQLQCFAFSTTFNGVSAHVLQQKFTEIYGIKIE